MQLQMLPHEIYLVIFNYIPVQNYKLRLLNRKFSECEFLYDNWDVLIAIGYKVSITKDFIGWYKDEVLHSLYLDKDNYLPAMTWDNGTKLWYKNGEQHRDNDLPAVIDVRGSRRWYQNGKLHRDTDLPARIYTNGSKEWCKNDKLHRDNDLPAVINANGNKLWYKNGELHRDNNLPAIIWADGRREWWKNGIRYYPV